MDDVANTKEEENFTTGMRQNAMEYSTHDGDQDNRLDFDEFSSMVRFHVSVSTSQSEPLLEAHSHYHASIGTYPSLVHGRGVALRIAHLHLLHVLAL